mmetsp:Transcript_14308/g.18695  ORF Transcript_14308/g.18695 Transcript_14308/m.18695 type:complete len:357 (+) Transcript_14308:388-1458(+)|eukprot:CAMPEP_0198152316 /NCGR_PEP_ID=MMETSP1443-20131203/59329_1 /TAXON_ID=186043 /ORGANISM="Entomoneis sp., Strain CCMP2396" /LENGTH=356 /DNA_ID=CAMNT_0043818295 /DNA_START=313 /DNA_END=1383 /DNA_ORIENTATION=+
MKYIQDNALAQWTSALTEVSIGHSRILHGRLEMYSMKRVSSDKKYAAVLGEKYVEQIQQDQELAAILPPTPVVLSDTKRTRGGRKRSQSTGRLEEASSSCVTFSPDLIQGGVSNSTTTTSATTTSGPPSKRSRSCSLDEGLKPRKAVTALGDFNETGTRRLMTDLVLTLNASFPDYDFSSIKPTDFKKLPVKDTVHRVNESLSEWATASVYNNLNGMWHTIDQSLQLKDCDVYKFIPPEDNTTSSFLMSSVGEDSMGGSEDGDSSDVAEGMSPTHGGGGSRTHTVLWSFYYLFVNKHLKRILLFSGAESMRQSVYSDDDEGGERYIQLIDGGGVVDDNFDLDPEANTAGGTPISTV